jgi:galactokinase
LTSARAGPIIAAAARAAAAMNAAGIAESRRRWADHFGGRPALAALSPGRVNLIGEHVDYVGGTVLPMAIDRHVAVLAAPNGSGVLRFRSTLLGLAWELPLDRAPGDLPAAPPGVRLLDSVVRELLRAGLPLAGADLLIEADLRAGAGLSSSAAVEVGVARALAHAAGAPWHPLAMAACCRQAEEHALGVRCGPMDQVAAACGRAGAALLLDCGATTLDPRPVPLPEAAAFVVLDGGPARQLAATEYNARRRSCETALAALGHAGLVSSLRDLHAELLPECRPLLDPLTFRRLRHVVGELPRAREMAAALAAGDLPAAGALMNASHESLATLYEVSTPWLDEVTARARAQPACHGARLTGAGFGGCALALVERAHVERFVRAMAAGGAGAFEVRAEAGARILP